MNEISAMILGIVIGALSTIFVNYRYRRYHSLRYRGYCVTCKTRKSIGEDINIKASSFALYDAFRKDHLDLHPTHDWKDI